MKTAYFSQIQSASSEIKYICLHRSSVFFQYNDFFKSFSVIKKKDMFLRHKSKNIKHHHFNLTKSNNMALISISVIV